MRKASNPRHVQARYRTLLLYLVLFSMQVPGVAVLSLPSQLQSLLSEYKQAINNTIQQVTIPNAYGNCSSYHQEGLCIDVGDVYYEHNEWYIVRAKYISGLNTLTLRDMRFISPEVHDATREHSKFVIVAYFEDLPLRVQVHLCVPFFGCFRTIDSTEYCCGHSKEVEIIIDLPCCTELPYLCHPTIDSIHLTTPIFAQYQVWNKVQMNLINLTSSIEAQLQPPLDKYVLQPGVKYMNQFLASILPDTITF